MVLRNIEAVLRLDKDSTKNVIDRKSKNDILDIIYCFKTIKRTNE